MKEYNVHIENFEGPLDLLLHLVKEKEMDLLTLEISKITDQYLNYIYANQHLHLEVASEYLVMAAYLIETKSKMLLPKEVVKIDDEYEEDPREKLIKRLIEYKRYKDVLDQFVKKYEERAQFHIKLPSSMESFQVDTSTMLPTNLEIYDLMKALQKMYQRQLLLKPLMQQAVAKKEISIDERTQSIIKRVKRHFHGKLKFTDLLEEVDRQYFVITFLAVLVLVNQKELVITQENKFGDIYLEAIK